MLLARRSSRFLLRPPRFHRIPNLRTSKLNTSAETPAKRRCDVSSTIMGVRWIGLLWACALASGCGPHEPAASRPDVVIVTLDTTRQDMLGVLEDLAE